MNKKELIVLINEAYYDIDYAMSDHAKKKQEVDQYLKQAMNWLEQAKRIIEDGC